jgi:hypothetical protein
LPSNCRGDVVPDGNGGVLATWLVVPGDVSGLFALTVADIGASGTVQARFSNLSMNVPSQPVDDNLVVLSDTNTAFTTDGHTVVSFNVSTLTQNRSYASTGGTLSFVAATLVGGVILISSNS